ncbi:uncharacterized protein LOC126793927 [Argentina anserina]|uniref:uncharacterized protein LOC126793927 n=1 Tax=Argentina anserina TaxID=57926 RepID=UPI00217668B2|nr:uncharacterized protein LOC126793927 [Potentilla anserina]
MEITEEQRKRAEANRLAALAKRKALAESSSADPWSLFKCRKLSPDLKPTSIRRTRDASRPEISLADPVLENQMFRVRLEICSPDSFSATPVGIQGFAFPGQEECLRRLSDCLASVMPSHYTQNDGGGKAGVYKLSECKQVVRCLKSNKGIDVEEIPWTTFNVVKRFSESYITGISQGSGCRAGQNTCHRIRGGRCLIADEMGLGKTVQAALSQHYNAVVGS